MGVVALLVSMAPASVMATALPVEYKIEGVPLYQQIDAKGCGPAALQMIFDYYGEFVDQKEIYNAARAGGTPLPDMARAAQFSDLSTTVGERWPEYIVTGYTARPVGYAAFYYASDVEWMSQLQGVVAQGYPVAVLQNFYPDSEDPHYRVVVGYDQLREVFIVNDGWSREFKVPSGYTGSTNPMSNPISWDDEFPGMEMSYADFELAWRCPTDVWGIEGLRYGAVVVVPWVVEVSVPAAASPGEEVSVEVAVTYPCPAPFGGPDFPAFTASGVAIRVTATDGDGRPFAQVEADMGTLVARGTCSATFTIALPPEACTVTFEAWATGLVSGHLEEWKDYPAYDYCDRVGGWAASETEVA
jgi:hypothetical protein